MRNFVRGLLTLLLYKELRSEDRLVVLLRLHPEAALSVRPHLALGLHHVHTDVLLPLLAFLDEDCVALLRLPVLPDDGLVGGDVHTELFVAVKVYRRRRGGGVVDGSWGSVPRELGCFPSISGGRDRGQEEEGEQGEQGPHGGREEGD